MLEDDTLTRGNFLLAQTPLGLRLEVLPQVEVLAHMVARLLDLRPELARALVHLSLVLLCRLFGHSLHVTGHFHVADLDSMGLELLVQPLLVVAHVEYLVRVCAELVELRSKGGELERGRGDRVEFLHGALAHKRCFLAHFFSSSQEEGNRILFDSYGSSKMKPHTQVRFDRTRLQVWCRHRQNKSVE